MRFTILILMTAIVFLSCKRNETKMVCSCTYNYQSKPRLNHTETKPVRKLPNDSKYLTTYNYANGEITGAKRIGKSYGISKTLMGKVYYSIDCEMK